MQTKPKTNGNKADHWFLNLWNDVREKRNRFPHTEPKSFAFLLVGKSRTIKKLYKTQKWSAVGASFARPSTVNNAPTTFQQVPSTSMHPKCMFCKQNICHRRRWFLFSLFGSRCFFLFVALVVCIFLVERVIKHLRPSRVRIGCGGSLF